MGFDKRLRDVKMLMKLLFLVWRSESSYIITACNLIAWKNLHLIKFKYKFKKRRKRFKT